MRIMELKQFNQNNEEIKSISKNFPDEFKLNPELNEYTLEECLNTNCLWDILKRFDYNYNLNHSVKNMCEQFGVNDVDNFKSYENLAKYSHCYFIKLLRDYAIKQITIEEKSNPHILNTLEDLQFKLWGLKDGKLVSKLIKQGENEILNECKNGSSLEQKVFIGVSLYSQENKHLSKNHDVQFTIKVKDSSLKKSFSASSSNSSLSVVTESSSMDSNNNMPYNNSNNRIEMSQPVKNYPLKPFKVNLFYHSDQNKDRIDFFVDKVKFRNPNIEIEDVSSYCIEQIEYQLENDVPMFVLFDKESESLIDPRKVNHRCMCSESYHKCSMIQIFYKILYKKFLNLKFDKFFVFTMEDWTQYKTNETSFRNTWLLKQKVRKNTMKKVLIKPYKVPEIDHDFSPNFEYFLDHFDYPNFKYFEI